MSTLESIIYYLIFKPKKCLNFALRTFLMNRRNITMIISTSRYQTTYPYISRPKRGRTPTNSSFTVSLRCEKTDESLLTPNGIPTMWIVGILGALQIAGALKSLEKTKTFDIHVPEALAFFSGQKSI